jgi:hypothetical protein
MAAIIAPMQTLRHATHIARFMLVWFALVLGVAIASPMVKPQALQLVCSGAGAVKVVVTGDDGKLASSSHSLDCPLCANLGAPPPVEMLAFAAATPREFAAPDSGADALFFVLAAPPPARGPPTL